MAYWRTDRFNVMVVYADGLPRTGKSYFATNYIYNNIDNYSKIYTNINGMKLSDKIKPLNFDKLRDIFAKCKDIFDDTQSSLGLDESIDTIVLDDKFIEYLLEIDFLQINPRYAQYEIDVKDYNELNFFAKLFKKAPKRETPYLNVLLVIDEAYNYFEPKRTDELLLWLLSYHGHLFIDIILMSQDAGDINQIYLRRVEYFLHAMSSSRGILNFSFRYQKFLKYPYNTSLKYGSFVGDIKIKKSQKIFDMYKSGDKGGDKSAVLKYIFISFLLLICIIISIFFIQRYIFSAPSDDLKVDTHSSPTSPIVSTVDKKTPKVVQVSNVILNNQYLKVVCIADNCNNNLFGDVGIDKDTFLSLISISKSNIVKTKTITKQITIYSLLISDSFIGYFANIKKEDKKSFF